MKSSILATLNIRDVNRYCPNRTMVGNVSNVGNAGSRHASNRVQRPAARHNARREGDLPMLSLGCGSGLRTNCSCLCRPTIISYLKYLPSVNQPSRLQISTLDTWYEQILYWTGTRYVRTCIINAAILFLRDLTFREQLYYRYRQ